MRFQDQVVRQTQKALDDLCRAALAIPADKHDWSPGGEARSTLSQMQEIAASGHWFIPILESGTVPEFGEHARMEAARLRSSFTTVELCIQAARTQTAELCSAISQVSDVDLERELVLPFGGGTTMTLGDICGLHAWNMVYHLGQLNQIQLLLGDRKMH